jgi:CHRD domain-containing protein
MSIKRRFVVSAVLAAAIAGGIGIGTGPALAHTPESRTDVSRTAAGNPAAGNLTDVSSAVARKTRSVTFRPVLTGDQEVGVVGSARGSVTVTLRLNPTTGSVTFRRLVPNLLFEREDEFGPTKFHIHRGVEGQNGPVVVDMTAVADQGQSRGRVMADRALVAEIAAHPEDFYLNYHTISHPDGAVRAQLR